MGKKGTDESGDVNKHFVDGYNANTLELKIEAEEASKKRKLYIHMVILMLSSTANIVVQTYQNESNVTDP
jgi:hypothetical protein